MLVVVNFGGMPTIDRDGEMVPDGMQGVRFFNPCAANGDCQIYENPPVRISLFIRPKILIAI